jgi:nucleoside-diphosphate-sugar epimerase
MRVFAGGASDAIGARLVPQLIDHAHKVTGTDRSPRNAEPVTLDQQPARAWRRIVGGS